MLAEACVSATRWVGQLWRWNDRADRIVIDRVVRGGDSVTFDKWYLDSMWHIVKINFLSSSLDRVERHYTCDRLFFSSLLLVVWSRLNRRYSSCAIEIGGGISVHWRNHRSMGNRSLSARSHVCQSVEWGNGKSPVLARAQLRIITLEEFAEAFDRCLLKVILLDGLFNQIDIHNNRQLDRRTQGKEKCYCWEYQKCEMTGW